MIAVIAEDGEDWKDVAANAKEEPADESAEEETSSSPPKASEPSGGSTPGTEVKMPALSPTMQEGTIVKWCVNEGEKINAGDVLCEIQTDKAVVSMDIDEDCVLAKILVPEGTANVKIGTLIAMTVDEGEDWKDVQIPAQDDSDSEPAPAATAAADDPLPVARAPSSSVQQVHVARVGPASNLLMTQYGINPGEIEASGPKGLTKGDVMRHIKDKNLSPLDLSVPVPPKPKQEEPVKVKRPDFNRPASMTRMEMPGPSAAAPKPGAGYTDVPLTTMRSVIAKRLLQSKQTSPHGHSTAECKMDAISQIRADYLNGAGIKISVNDLVIKATATALQYVPEVNINAVSEDDFQVKYTSTSTVRLCLFLLRVLHKFFKIVLVFFRKKCGKMRHFLYFYRLCPTLTFPWLLLLMLA